ncbi:MAG: M28 family peptidase, partial [Candidatus Hydrogenedentes bacterium]|nr:M28 family peptidase [Candidatus Hydrogenedentota bacterium]
MRKIFALLVAAGLVLSASLMGCSGCTSSSLFPVARSETVVQMIAGVQQAEVERLLRELTGESPIEVGGVTLTLTTRNTGNEAATRLATQFVFEFMQDRDIGVVYHDWADPEEGIAGRNVIAQMDGVDRPDEIVMITAHVDCMPDEGRAPGADDNASGSVGVMLAAAQLAGHTFERTIRFVLFTGEEYGPSG